MREETKEFIKGWELKLSQINSEGDELKELYDKFITLFTIYNRYYNEALFILKKENKLQKERYSDYEKATSIVIEFLGSKNIINNFDKNDDLKVVDQVSNLINDLFHINLADGIPKINTDKQLVKNLENDSPDIKSKAILSLIYNVRCNIVHGHKNFNERQRLIVEPLVDLLETLIKTFETGFKNKTESAVQ